MKWYNYKIPDDTRRHACINGVLDESKYSSPVPIIGLYIAAGSFLLLLFMILDILSARRLRKPWIPCQLFSLNSLTLTLLAICVKLPLDLTTPMPSAQDQLCKLTGNALIGMSMVFFAPSVANMSSDSERTTNLTALSILVVTVVVNICIQIGTGVIYQFIGEHVWTLILTCFGLLKLWALSFCIDLNKEKFHKESKKLLINGVGSMLGRLKFCYLRDFKENSQVSPFGLGGIMEAFDFIFCFSHSFIVILYFLKSCATKKLKFCGGKSDYKWSMWIILATQVVIFIVGFFAHITRLKFVIRRSVEHSDWETVEAVIDRHELLRVPLKRPYWNLQWTELLANLSSHQHREEVTELEEFRPLIRGEHSEWLLRKALNEMSRETKAVPLVKVVHFLARTNPSPALHITHENKYPDEQGIQVSSLSLALLVKIATFSIPTDVHENGAKALEEVLNEVCDIVYSIEARTNYAWQETELRIKLAKAVLVGSDFDTQSYNSEILRYKKEDESYTGFTRASLIIRHLRDVVGYRLVEAVGSITELISHRELTSIEDLYLCIEQIFVDMLHLFLAQIPHVIVKEMTDCSTEDFKEMVISALKLIHKIRPLDAHVQWLFPSGCNNLSSLI